MATSDPTSHSQLDVISEEIKEVFERILSEVRARRDELLEQVSELEREFKTKNISVVQSMRELEEMRIHLEKMSVKQNLAVKKQRESLADIDSEIEKLKIDLNSKSKFKFNCFINQLIDKIKHFGEVIDESCVITKYQSIYSKKLTAVKEITGHQDIKFIGSVKLHIDSDKQLLYVLNLESTNDRYGISVFNANDFAFNVEFGQGEFTAHCIATSKEFVYVGYVIRFWQDRLIQYKYSDYSVVKTIYTNKFSSGIFISSENRVYVLSYSDKTYKFHIYDRALNFKEERDLCYLWPETISGRSMTKPAKQREELFYILFDEQLLVFTQEGKNIRSIFHEEGKSLS